MKPIFLTHAERKHVLTGEGVTKRLMLIKSGDHKIRRDGDFPGSPNGLTYGVELEDRSVIAAPFQPHDKYHAGDTLYVKEPWVLNQNRHSPDFGKYELYSDYDGALCQSLITWNPAISMPKAAAKLFLRVTGVKAQRFEELTVEDILAEGIDIEPPPICTAELTDKQIEKLKKMSKKDRDEYIHTLATHKYMGWCEYAEGLMRHRRELWNAALKSNEREKYLCLYNPWIWVISFEKCDGEEVQK